MLNKIKFGLVALLLPLLAFGQSYPSPTFNNVTSQGTATLNNATVSGTFTSTGNIGLTSLASQVANTVVANVTGSGASPTAFAMPSCSTSASALNWTSGSGFTCNTAVNAATLGGATFAAPGSIGGTTPGSGAFTSLSANSAVSGTGFTSLLSPYATLASPALTGTPTAPTAPLATNTTQVATTAFVISNSVTSSSPTITTPNIVGVTNASNANAGSVGEVLSNSTTGTSATTGIPLNATSVSLTAGDWDVSGFIEAVPAGTTTTSQVTVGISSTSSTFQNITGSFLNATSSAAAIPAGLVTLLPAPVTRINVTSATTVYLVGSIGFATSTMTVNGFIRARRLR